MTPSLPDSIPPMLARSGRPFDSEEHLFEIKWDGFRAIAYVDEGLRLLSRRRNDLAPRYPELDVLRRLPAGTVVDGEIVLLRDGRADFYGLLAREQARGASRVRAAAAREPTTYVVFDLLFEHHESIMDRPLTERRERLAALVGDRGEGSLVLSEGVVGAGRTFFERAGELAIEGVVAKQLGSAYLPGKRTEAWTKSKHTRRLHCAIVGFVPDGPRDFKSLIIASDVGGELRCVGRVGSGLSEVRKAELRELLFAREVDEPLIDCGMAGRWVEPGLYCTVSFLERTNTGTLRAPVFVELITE